LTPIKHQSSSEFEWTIEELSNLNPVNLVPHPTQFRDDETLDPAREAQFQAAISSFFKEQNVVPSPACASNASARSQRVQQLYKESNSSNTPLKIYNSTLVSESLTVFKCQDESDIFSSKPYQQYHAQSTNPPNRMLPNEIKDFSTPSHDYDFRCDETKIFSYNDSSKNNDDEDELDSNISGNENDKSMMDVSTLRRKLFIHRPSSPFGNDCSSDNAIDLELNLSPAPKTPELHRFRIDQHHHHHQQQCGEVLSENAMISSDLFGELSPIANTSAVASLNCSSALSSCNDISMMSMTSDGNYFKTK
jgi:hypothetical protein